MNNRRSYLDSLNAGRTRKAHASIDDLTRTLDALEQRISRPSAAGYDRAVPSQGERSRRDREPMPPRTERTHTIRSRDEADYSLHSLAREVDRVRYQEEGAATASRLASELKTLREELRQQMSSGMKQEFESLRHDIARLYDSAGSLGQADELGAEFERLSQAIHALSERSDDRSINMLRLELEQVKGALQTLAREETTRFRDQERRWSSFEDRYSSGRTDPAIAALTDRLEQIATAVHNLPESLSLRSMEEKVRTLAGAVDHFVQQKDQTAGVSFAQIEERLDEISRAIVVSASAAAAPAFDPEPFERIEARISSLAAQLEDIADERPGIEVLEQLAALSGRVDDLAARGALPEKAIERLGHQVSVIASRIDRLPTPAETDTFVRGMEERFDILADLVERRQGDAIESGQSMFRDMEQRLDQVASRLDERREPNSDGLMRAIDQRFADFARRLETRPAVPSPAMEQLETRLDDISSQLQESSAKVAGIDRDLIRSLETQVAALSAHLARPNQPLPEFEDIAPRLDQIEQKIADSRSNVLDAARRAADEAVRALGPHGLEGAAAAGLAQDLQSLEQLSRRADERNTKTFEAIHDTLLKIVDRLGMLEQDRAGRFARAEPDMPRRPLESVPSMVPAMDASLSAVAEAASSTVPSVGRTPAQAAAAAAFAALDEEDKPVAEPSGRVKSMLGGLTRAFSRKERVEPTLEPVAEPTPLPEMGMSSLDQPLDPKVANRPLEPGSGAPDLSAIMRRVRDERGHPTKPADMDTAKSDFIAAARRAAQAAAAEAEIAKRNLDKAGTEKGAGLARFFKMPRKPVLMAAAAILVALAGLQLGKGYFGTGSQTQVASKAIVTAAPEVSTTASVDLTSIPEGSDEVALAETNTTGDGVSNTRAVRRAEAGPSSAAADITNSTEPAKELLVFPTSSPAVTVAIPDEVGPLALRDAATEGDPKALFEIGSRYAEARGVKEDMAAAAKWYEQSAELGLAPAQYRIGNFYEKGIGVTRDIAKAKTWYQMAAEQGNASAMHNLAVLYAMGTDGPADNETAARWFLEAADFGVKDSQFNLGILFAKGVGVQQSLEESYKWFALVAKAGDRDAAAKRDEIANALRPDQLTRARGTTELWKAKQVDAEANTVEVPEDWRESETTTASVDMRKAVRNIQLILNKNGYDAGSADGLMGAKTKTAISAFQEANGMKPTGEVDEQLVKVLLANK